MEPTWAAHQVPAWGPQPVQYQAPPQLPLPAPRGGVQREEVPQREEVAQVHNQGRNTEEPQGKPLGIQWKPTH